MAAGWAAVYHIIRHTLGEWVKNGPLASHATSETALHSGPGGAVVCVYIRTYGRSGQILQMARAKKVMLEQGIDYEWPADKKRGGPEIEE